MLKTCIALASGAFLPLALAPFDCWPAAIIAVAGLFWVIEILDSDRSLPGWWFGVGKYAVGGSRMYVSIHEHGGASPVLAGSMVLLFVLFMALFSWAMVWLYQRIRTQRLLANAWLFAAMFVLWEWVLTWFLTGFPWLYVGYGFLSTSLAGYAPLGGVLLVSFFVCLTGTLSYVLIAQALLRARREPITASTGLLAGTTILLIWLVGFAAQQVEWVSVERTKTVAMVQGNIEQKIKWLPESRQPILQTYTSLSKPHWNKDLVIWPEAALTIYHHEAENLLATMVPQNSNASLVLGIPAVASLAPGEWAFENTAIAVGGGSGRYVKQRLVPFGEYVPLEDLLRGLIQFFDLPMSHARSGPRDQANIKLAATNPAALFTAGVAICYEVVYPDLVRRQAQTADILITISNDSWFGRSIGPLQHMQMAQMRALENGRAMLRSTNNGVTAIVDHQGRVTKRLPQFVQGVLVGDVQLMRGSTPYTKHGHLPLFLVVLVVFTIALFRSVFRQD